MPVSTPTALGGVRRKKRAWFYPEEEVIALIVIASWLNMLLHIT